MVSYLFCYIVIFIGCQTNVAVKSQRSHSNVCNIFIMFDCRRRDRHSVRCGCKYSLSTVSECQTDTSCGKRYCKFYCLQCKHTIGLSLLIVYFCYSRILAWNIFLLLLEIVCISLEWIILELLLVKQQQNKENVICPLLLIVDMFLVTFLFQYLIGTFKKI